MVVTLAKYPKIPNLKNLRMSSEGIIWLKGGNMMEGGVMEDVVKTEVEKDTPLGDENDQPFALLLRVTQSDGRPLPIGGFMG